MTGANAALRVPAFIDANGDIRDCKKQRKYAQMTSEGIEFQHDKIKGGIVFLPLDIEKMRILLEMQRLAVVSRILNVE